MSGVGHRISCKLNTLHARVSSLFHIFTLVWPTADTCAPRVSLHDPPLPSHQSSMPSSESSRRGLCALKTSFRATVFRSTALTCRKRCRRQFCAPIIHAPPMPTFLLYTRSSKVVWVCQRRIQTMVTPSSIAVRTATNACRTRVSAVGAARAACVLVQSTSPWPPPSRWTHPRCKCRSYHGIHCPDRVRAQRRPAAAHRPGPCPPRAARGAAPRVGLVWFFVFVFLISEDEQKGELRVILPPRCPI